MIGMGLIQRSFYGGILILVILAVRAALLGRLPKRTFPVLWGVALLRLLLPLSFSSVFSVYSLLPSEQGFEILEDAAYGMMEGTTLPDSPAAWTGTQKPVPEIQALSVSAKNPFPVLLIVWAAGTIACAAFFVLAYLRCLRDFRTAVPINDAGIRQWLDSHKTGRFLSVRQSDTISAPLTYGILRPVILLPKRLMWEDRQELEYVLQHEYVHICHYDAALKLTMVAALCIHWFNPLVWLMAGLLNRDIELACDEQVLRRFGEPFRADYAMTLIRMEEKKRGLLPLYNGFSKNATEERIKLIMKYKRITFVTGMTALLLVLSIVLVFATSAKPAKATENPENPPGNGIETGGTDTPTDVPLDPPRNSMEPDTAAAEEQPMALYKGDGYSILIPSEGWLLYAPDAWLCKSNEQVQVWVNDCSGSTYDQVISRLMADGYSLTEESNLLMKEGEERSFFIKIQESGFIIMCVNYTYPAESESTEEYATLLHTIARSFTIVPEDNDENLSEDGKQLKQLALSFWKAYLTGNMSVIEQYLAADYSWDIDIFPDGVDGHVAEEAFVQTVKGLDVEEKSLGDTLEIWVEFRPAAGVDYLEYLTLEVIKEQDGWKVLAYGLEL